MTSTDAQISQLREAIDRQIEADKLFEADIRATLDLSLLSPPPPPTASPPLAPPTPEVSEDRYKKGWSDAWDLIMPQLYELQRRNILISRVAADPWVVASNHLLLLRLNWICTGLERQECCSVYRMGNRALIGCVERQAWCRRQAGFQLE